MSVVKHRILDEIALIEVSNPPVNAISAAVRIGLLETIEELSLDEKILLWISMKIIMSLIFSIIRTILQ